MAKNYFEEVYQKLFKKQLPKQPIIHEQLKRSDQYLEAYTSWESSDARENLMDDLDRAYHLKKQQIESAMKVHLLESQYANGFAITYNDVFTGKNFQYLFDFLKEKVKIQGYKLAQADRRISDKDTYEETIEKWYLKPLASDFSQEKINQRFGNVIIEMILIDRKPSFIRLMANVYQDRLYANAEPFDELFNKLVSN